jgi:hypothetical protein
LSYGRGVARAAVGRTSPGWACRPGRHAGANCRLSDNAHDRTRTCTPFLALVPQTSLSTNFSTWACGNCMLGEGFEPSQDYSHRILNPARLPVPPSEQFPPRPQYGLYGAEGNRTPDLLNAIQALSQLSYSPMSRARGPGSGTTLVVKQLSCSAGLTGLEPATSGVTDRHSNRLSYSP